MAIRIHLIIWHARLCCITIYTWVFYGASLLNEVSTAMRLISSIHFVITLNPSQLINFFSIMPSLDALVKALWRFFPTPTRVALKYPIPILACTMISRFVFHKLCLVVNPWSISVLFSSIILTNVFLVKLLRLHSIRVKVALLGLRTLTMMLRLLRSMITLTTIMDMIPSFAEPHINSRNRVVGDAKRK